MKRHNDQSIKEVLAQLIKANPKMDKGLTQQRIVQVWKENLGQVINNYTEEIQFSRGKLRVKLTSAPLRNELAMGKQKLINMLNERIGEETIKELIFL